MVHIDGVQQPKSLRLWLAPPRWLRCVTFNFI
jgi:hypothetical protein